MYVLTIDPETKRILSAAIMPHPPEAATLVDALPTGETDGEKDIRNWIYTDGAYVYDPLPDAEPVEAELSTDARIARLEEQNRMLTDCLLEMSEVVYA